MIEGVIEANYKKCLSVACHPLQMGNCISGTLVSLQCATVKGSPLGLVLRGKEIMSGLYDRFLSEIVASKFS